MTHASVSRAGRRRRRSSAGAGAERPGTGGTEPHRSTRRRGPPVRRTGGAGRGGTVAVAKPSRADRGQQRLNDDWCINDSEPDWLLKGVHYPFMQVCRILYNKSEEKSASLRILIVPTLIKFQNYGHFKLVWRNYTPF